MREAAANAAVRACAEDVASRIGRGRATLLLLLCTVAQNATRLQLLADSDYYDTASAIAQAVHDAVTLAVVELGIDPREVEICAAVLAENCGTMHHSQPIPPQ